MRRFCRRTLPLKEIGLYSWRVRVGRGDNVLPCAKHPKISCDLWQFAEFHFLAQKLFLIGSAVSGLPVTLPNMDRMTGGGLE